MNYKPFDLEAAKAGKAIICRDGTPAKFIAYVEEAYSSKQVVVRIVSDISCHWRNGTFGMCTYSIDPKPKDLFMAPEKKTVWVDIFEGGQIANANRVLSNTEWDTRIACVEITYEEGQGL